MHKDPVNALPTSVLEVARCSDRASWDDFVHSHAQASPYHQWAWKTAIEASFGHAAHYLSAMRNNRMEGVLPLIEMKSRMFGHFLVSLPFVNYGGLLASSEEAGVALLQRAEEIARASAVEHIELRQGAPSAHPWQDTSAKVAMVVLLPATEEELWSGLSSRLRNKIRHARKQGLESRWGGSELLGDFYPVFAANMRNLGTPVYPRSWFENAARAAGPDGRILLLTSGGRAVAATFVLTFRDRVELPWIASTPAARGDYSTVLLYWEALAWALRNGYRSVDLGRCSPGSGTHRFKQQWKPEERPLHWYYWLAEGRSLPHLRPDNPKYHLAVSVWKRLPLAVANGLGPRIVRFIP